MENLLLKFFLVLERLREYDYFGDRFSNQLLTLYALGARDIFSKAQKNAAIARELSPKRRSLGPWK